MLGETIRILNFDDSVIKQKKLLGIPKNNIIDLKGLGPWARYFYSSATRGLVAGRLNHLEKNAITFLGSGDFHHISELLISQFDQPLSVIIFDFHPDWEVSMVRYGCGSWVRGVLEKRKNIAKLILLGVSSDDISSFNLNSGYLDSLKNNRVEIYPYAHGPSKVIFKNVPENISIKARRGIFSTIYWQELKDKNLEEFFLGVLKRIPTKDVYVSIDKDCLKHDFALTNWEEGKLSLDELLLLLKLIKEKLNIIGLDITGDYSPIFLKGLVKKIASALDHPKHIKAQAQPEFSITALNEETNMKILSVFFEAG